MGKFDGYLICTDYDGTFATKTEPVPENIPAVRYFTENGGKFTVATGRTVGFIREKNLTHLINAPACLYNGSVVYDYAAEKTLRALCLHFTVQDALNVMKDQLHLVNAMDVFEEMESHSQLQIWSLTEAQLQAKCLKLLFRFLTPELADAFKTAAEERLSTSVCHISKSWALGVEFNPPEGTKGHALDYIKSLLPDVHTAIGVGDNDNDRILLRHADLAAAPENAVDSLKAIARFRLKPCTEGAIADLIRQLEEIL